MTFVLIALALALLYGLLLVLHGLVVRLMDTETRRTKESMDEICRRIKEEENEGRE